MGLFTNEGMKLKKLCYWAPIGWQSIEHVHIERGSLKTLRGAVPCSLHGRPESLFSNLSASRCGYSRPTWWYVVGPHLLHVELSVVGWPLMWIKCFWVNFRDKGNRKPGR